jgi:group I intron endonuclease
MREPISGVYKITNLENGKVYIGKSQDIRLRWSQHEIIRKMKLLKELRNENNVSFELLEKVPIDRLSEIEEYYIKTFQSFKPDKGYNIQGKRKLNNDPKKAMTIYISRELHLKLKLLAIEKGIPINDLAEAALKEWLKKYQKGE